MLGPLYRTLIRRSDYFKNLLSKTRGTIMMDFKEGVFEWPLLLMRYGAGEALPPVSQNQAFRRKEAELYGAHYSQSPSPPKSPPDIESPASSPTAAPRANNQT
ncbi:hypothetical protein L7F22_026784 [Adiantum nelumboides]|nr:hypothetical protein [Adiantum nelumboides]